MNTLNEILKSVGVSAQEKAEVGHVSTKTDPVVGAFDTTDWHVGTFTPGLGGEYEILHPVTGMVERAEYDPLFEAWSCEWQYPTWRGLRGVL